MTKQRWTSEKQRQWLEEFIPKFLEAQANDETSDVFFPEVHRQWALEFPHPKPSATDIEKANGNQEKAAALLIKKTEKRVSQWFHNTTRPSGGKQPIIKLSKQATKVCADWQAYQSLYYENKLKALVDEEYEKHKKNLKEGEKPKPRIKIQTDIVRAEYNKESEEVKAEVEAYRLKMKEDSDVNSTAEKKLEAIANAVERVPSTLAAILRALRNETGWSFTVLAGGPSPRHEGKIATYIMHDGHTAEKATEQFEEFVGKAHWNENILGQWDQFLHGVYPPAVRAARSLGKSSKQSTPDVEGREEGREEGNEDARGSQKECSETEREENTDGAIQPSRGGLSEYEIRKAKNIARNEELVAELKERYKIPVELDDVFTTKKRKEGQQGSTSNDKVKDIEDVNEANVLSSSTATPTLSAPESPPLTGVPVPGQTPHVLDGATSTENAAVSAHQAGSNDESISSNGNSAHEPLQAADGHSTCRTKKTVHIDIASDVSEVTDDIGRIRDDPGEMEVDVDVEESHNAGGRSLRRTAARRDKPASTAKPRSKQAGTVSKSRSKPASTVAQSRSKPESPDSEPRPPPSSSSSYLDEFELYLKEVSREETWSALIEKWKEFERTYPVTGNITTYNRPEEIHWWQKRGRKIKSVPLISDLDAFRDQWRLWWASMQPEWRVSDAAWPPSRAVPESSQPWPINAGQSGIFLVIIALAWWGQAVDSDVQTNDFLSSADDVFWVITQMLADVQNAKKRSADGDPAAAKKPISKKARKSL